MELLTVTSPLAICSALLVACSQPLADESSGARASSVLASPTDGGSAARVDLRMKPVPVPAGGERFVCQDFSNPFGEDVIVVSSSSLLVGAARHVVVLMLPGLADSSVADCPFLARAVHDFSQAVTSPDDPILYEETGRLVKAGMGFRVNAHLVNPTGTPGVGSARFEMAYVPANDAEQPPHPRL